MRFTLSDSSTVLALPRNHSTYLAEVYGLVQRILISIDISVKRSIMDPESGILLLFRLLQSCVGRDFFYEF